MLSINKANFLVKFILDLLDTYLFDTHCVVGTGLVRQCVCVRSGLNYAVDLFLRARWFMFDGAHQQNTEHQNKLVVVGSKRVLGHREIERNDGFG